MLRYLLVVVSVAALPVRAVTPVTLCDVIADPAAYNGRVIEVTAFVSHGFEDFTLFDPRCSSGLPSVWVEYGGTFASGTMYCCDVGGERRREEPLVVESVVTDIVEDAMLRKFDELLQREPDSIVHATLRGRFFAGKKTELPGGTFWIGYGHFGLFSLFVIEQVVRVDGHDIAGLDYRAHSDGPAIGGRAGCYVKPLSGLEHAAAIERQRKAEAARLSWMFTNPRRVAEAHLRHHVSDRPAPQMKRIHRAPGRMVYEGRMPDGSKTYRIVVARPYWMSFFAAKRNRVAWVPVAAYEAGCE